MGIFDMTGEVDYDFTTHDVVFVKDEGQFIDGAWVQVDGERKTYQACVQPVGGRELSFLQNGGERISDFRKLYITQKIEGLELDGVFEFLGQRWKVVDFDDRPENTYTKITVARIDL